MSSSSFILRLSSLPPAHTVRGEWRTDGDEWCAFSYVRTESGSYNGTFFLCPGVDDVCFYEYDVSLTYDPITCCVVGSGRNRFGEFRIRGNEYEWVKEYIIQKRKAKRRPCYDLGYRRTQFQVARALRVVFRDRMYDLEQKLRSGVLAIPSVRSVLVSRGATEEELSLLQQKLHATNRRAITYHKHVQFEKELTRMEQSVREMCEKVRKALVKKKRIHFKLEEKEARIKQAGVTHEAFLATIDAHDGPLFGIRIEEGDYVLGDAEGLTDEFFIELLATHHAASS